MWAMVLKLERLDNSYLPTPYPYENKGFIVPLLVCSCKESGLICKVLINNDFDNEKCLGSAVAVCIVVNSLVNGFSKSKLATRPTPNEVTRSSRFGTASWMAAPSSRAGRST